MRRSATVSVLLFAMLTAVLAAVPGLTALPARADGGWSTPAELSVPGQDAYSPRVAVSGGTAIATWTRQDGANRIVQVARSTDSGATWGTPVNLSVPGVVNDPRLAISGSTVIVTWWRQDSFKIVQFARSTDGGATWGTPVDLSATNLDLQYPQVAISGSNAVITWYQALRSNTFVQAVHSSDGGATWGTPVDLSETGQNAQQPQVAMSGTTAIVTWQREDGANRIVQAARSTDGGATWAYLGGTAANLSQTGQNAEYPQVAISGSTAIVTWHRWDGSNYVVQAARSGDGGATWTYREATAVNLSATGVTGAQSPQVAISGSTAIVTWHRWDGTNWLVQAARSADGGATWTYREATAVNLSATERDSQSPQVAISDSNAIITWMQGTSTPFIAQAARSSDAGATWASAVNLSATDQNSYSPVVAITGDTAIASWYLNDGVNNSVRASTLALSGGGGGDSGGGGGGGSSTPTATPTPTPTPTAEPTTAPASQPVAASEPTTTPTSAPVQLPVRPSALRPSQVAQLTPAMLRSLSRQYVAGLRPGVIAAMSGDQLAALPSRSFLGLTARQAARLSPGQLRALPARSLAMIHPYALRSLPRASVRAMAPSTLRDLSPRAAKRILRALKGSLTPAQRRALVAASR